jgi:glycosyltransferase involved in cell wall biosynthesis
MKICRFTCSYSPYQFGGADIFAECLTEHLLERGHLHSVISINPEAKDSLEYRQNIRIHRFHPFNVTTVHSVGRAGLIKQVVWTALDIYSYYSYLKIKNILRQERPDVVHMHTSVDSTLSAFKAAKSLGLPVVFTAHDYLPLCRRVVLLHNNGKLCTDEDINPICKLYRRFTRRLLDNNIDIVTAPSEFALGIYKKNGFFKNTASFVVPHGIKISNPNSDAGKKADRQNGAINILYIGGLTRHKGVHVLIKAFRGINNANIKLDIVGYGVYEDALKDLAEGDSRIIFHGKVPYSKVSEFYTKADILVVPSIWYEVFGRIILEGFSSGVPVICSDIGGMRELVKDDYNGFLFKAGDAEQLKRIICGVIRSPERLESLGLNAFASAKKYEISGCVDKFLEAYKMAIDINLLKKGAR